MPKRDHPEPPSKMEVSRRGFLKGAGAVLSSGIVAGAEALEAANTESAKVIGPGKAPVTLKINGVNKALNIEPRLTLLDALRDELELTGAKRVCDRTTCGACTVIVNGKSVYSCTMLAIEAQGNYVRLSLAGSSHLLRDTLNNIESQINPRMFVRIHRRTIVNIDRVKEVQTWARGEYRVVLSTGAHYTLSRGYRQHFEKFIRLGA